MYFYLKPGRFALTLSALVALVGVLALTLLAVVDKGDAATGPCGTRTTGHPTKFLVIWEENRAYTEVIGDSDAPYLNSLASQCGLATNYHGITHPSLPNYIAAVAGSTLSISTNCLPTSCPRTSSSLWGQDFMKAYAESMPSNCYLSNSGNYVPRHNSLTYFSNLRTGCRANDKPLGSPSSGALRSDLNAGALGPYNEVIPNQIHNSHDSTVKAADDYLKSLIPVILSSPDYVNGKLAVIVTWDENDGSSGNRVPWVAISPYTDVGQRSSTNFSHYSQLKTIQSILGKPCLRNACSASSMAGFF